MKNAFTRLRNISHRSVRYLLLFFVVLSSQAWADGIECNLGQFSLSAEQKERLKEFRVQNRQYMRQATVQQKNGDAYQRRVANLLLQKDFNDAQARRFVIERHEEQIEQDIRQLKMYHLFLQVLTPEQRSVWLKNCVRINY